MSNVCLYRINHQINACQDEHMTSAAKQESHCYIYQDKAAIGSISTAQNRWQRVNI